jgi:hypothetical protein
MIDELDALRQVREVLDDLPPEAVARILRWAGDKYGFLGAAEPVRSATQADQEQQSAGAAAADLPEYFHAAQASTDAEKALVVGAWFQQVQGLTDFDSASVNRELKNLGHPSTNITRDFDNLMARKPRLVVQTRKSGSSKQARKLYRVTHEGLAEVARMRGGQT